MLRNHRLTASAIIPRRIHLLIPVASAPGSRPQVQKQAHSIARRRESQAAVGAGPVEISFTIQLSTKSTHVSPWLRVRRSSGSPWWPLESARSRPRYSRARWSSFVVSTAMLQDGGGFWPPEFSQNIIELKACRESNATAEARGPTTAMDFRVARFSGRGPRSRKA